MLQALSTDMNRLRDYSSMFSRREVMAWTSGNFISLNTKIKRYDTDWLKRSERTYLDYLKHTYKCIKKFYRNEYVYKNELLNQWLIEQLGSSSSILFNEYRVGESIADLAMFNGHSRAFEIKTEYDSANRLALQIESYKQVFNEIFIIVPDFKIKEYDSVSQDIGIIAFSSKKNSEFFLHREATLDKEVSPSVIMNVLHTSEYKNIVNDYYGELPSMTSFNQYTKCRQLLEQIPNTQLNEMFIEAMKRRKTQFKLKKKQYNEFNQIRLSLNISPEAENQILQNLKTSIIL